MGSLNELKHLTRNTDLEFVDLQWVHYSMLKNKEELKKSKSSII